MMEEKHSVIFNVLKESANIEFSTKWKKMSKIRLNKWGLKRDKVRKMFLSADAY